VYTCENVTFQEGIDFKTDIRGTSGRRWHICHYDLVAVGVLSYFNDNKIKVPQQVAVIDSAIGLCRKYLLQN
jgi:LacI family transcriptional regulator